MTDVGSKKVLSTCLAWPLWAVFFFFSVESCPPRLHFINAQLAVLRLFGLSAVRQAGTLAVVLGSVAA